MKPGDSTCFRVSGRPSRWSVPHGAAGSVDRDPLQAGSVVGPMHDGDAAAHRPRDHLPVQGDVVHLRVVLGQRLPDDLAPLLDARLHSGGIDG